jgi:hypothetical protein
MTGIAIGYRHTIPGRQSEHRSFEVMLLRPAESRDLPPDQELERTTGLEPATLTLAR